VLPGEGATVHLRQHHVGDEQAERAFVMLQGSQGIDTRSRLDHRVAVPLEIAPQQAPDFPFPFPWW
jgi:hypothetical protein